MSNMVMSVDDVRRAVADVIAVVAGDGRGSAACFIQRFGSTIAHVAAASASFAADHVLEIIHLFAQFTKFCLEVGRRHGETLSVVRGVAEETLRMQEGSICRMLA